MKPGTADARAGTHRLPHLDREFAVLTCLTPAWSVSSRVTAFTATRLGGVSAPPFDALNLGLHVGDDEQAVRENRQRLQDAFVLPEEPHWLKQTHGTDMAVIVPSTREPEPACADGAWTCHENTVLAVLTADCLPVVISDVGGRAIAVVHAGWRGLAAGILDKALSCFDSGSELHAWLGPAIGPDAFEVGGDVKEAFIARNPRHAGSFRPLAAETTGKYLADLYELAREELRQCRSITVSGGEYCTVSQPDWFHSHRRDGVHSGRLATVAWISNHSD